MPDPSTAAAAPAWPSPGRLLFAQVRHHNRLFWRSRVAAIFTIAFPLMILVFSNSLIDERFDVGDGEVSVSQLYVPALAVFTAVSATYTGLIMQTALAREQGVLKRVRGTPLPPGLYLGGLVGSSIWVAALGTAVMVIVGWLAYDFAIDVARLPAAALAFVVGVATFSALGLAVSGLASDGRAASALANFTLLPVAFLSGVFVPLEDPPRWLELAGDVLPLKPFVRAFDAAFNPNVDRPGIAFGRLGVLAVWFVIGVALAIRTFRWMPADGASGATRRRAGRAPRP